MLIFGMVYSTMLRVIYNSRYRYIRGNDMDGKNPSLEMMTWLRSSTNQLHSIHIAGQKLFDTDLIPADELAETLDQLSEVIIRYESLMDKVKLNIKPPYVFVYGSLMRGKRKHGLFLEEAKFIGAATLYGYTPFNEGRKSTIREYECGTVYGEVYEVTPEIFEKLEAREDRKSVVWGKSGFS